MCRPRLDRIAIVVADQVQHAMSHQQIELGRQRQCEPARLTPRGLGGDHDLADEPTRSRRLERKRQNVGSTVDATVHAVEMLDRRIIHDEDVDVRAAPRHGV